MIEWSCDANSIFCRFGNDGSRIRHLMLSWWGHLRFILIARSSFLHRSRVGTLSSRSAQERAPYDKYKSSWCRFKLEAPFHKNSFGIFGALFFAQHGKVGTATMIETYVKFCYFNRCHILSRRMILATRIPKRKHRCHTAIKMSHHLRQHLRLQKFRRNFCELRPLT